MGGWGWNVTLKSFAQGVFMDCLIHPWGPFLQQFFLLISPLLLIQYLPEGKSSSPRFLKGSALGVSLLTEVFEFSLLQGEQHTHSFWCVIYKCVKKRVSQFPPLQDKTSSIKIFEFVLIPITLCRYYRKQD